VVRYAASAIVLIAARNLNTMEELNVKEVSEKFRWKMPREFKFSSLSEVAESARSLNPLKQKGFIVCDLATGNRIKVMNPIYISIQYLSDFTNIGGLNFPVDVDERRMFDLIKDNTATTVLAHFPHYRPYFEQIQASCHFKEFKDLLQSVRPVQAWFL